MKKSVDKFPLNKMVEVSWEDITTYAEWRDISIRAKSGVVSCKTIGYLINKDNKVIRLASTQAENEDLNSCTIIPRSNITKIRRLR